jgi:hypothetical protein
METVGALQAARTGDEFVELQCGLLAQLLRHEQMLAELMAPDTLIAAIRHSLAATAADRSERSAQHLVPYAGEPDVWFQGPASLVPG